MLSLPYVQKDNHITGYLGNSGKAFVKGERKGLKEHTVILDISVMTPISRYANRKQSVTVDSDLCWKVEHDFQDVL